MSLFAKWNIDQDVAMMMMRFNGKTRLEVLLNEIATRRWWG
jgi:hypothetical protein